MSFFQRACLRLPLLTGIAVLTLSSNARAQFSTPHDPHDQRAYIPHEYRKSTADEPLLLSTVQYITSAGSLSPYDSSRIVYGTGSDRVTADLIFRWSGGAWVPFARYTYKYDSQNRNDVTLYDTWSAKDTAFQPLVRYSYTHDASGARTSLFYEIWVVASKRYRNGLMEYYTLDGSGQQTAVLQQIWKPGSSSWDNNTNETFVYNPQGKILVQTLHGWDTASAAWIPKRLLSRSFDASGLNMTLEEESSWSTVSAAWTPKLRYVSVVTAAHIRSTTKEWHSSTTRSWDPASRETYSYNSHGDMDQVLASTWNASSRMFEDQYRSSYTYNSHFQPKRIDKLVPDRGKWTIAPGAEQTRFYYEGDTVEALSTGTAALAAGFSLSPVPASGRLHVRYPGSDHRPDALRVSDMSGRVVLSHRPEAGTADEAILDVGGLPAGTYVITALSEGRAPVSRRFAILR